MERKAFLWFIAGIGLLLITSPALTQEMQWLQYHCEQEAQRIIGDMRSSYSELFTEKPQGVELPEFKNAEPYFAKWSTPMTEAGFLWMSFDRNHKSGKLDRMFIDSNGNGHLNDESAITAYNTDQYYSYFGPVKVVFEGEDGPLTYHLNLRLYDREQRQRLYVYSGGWYEGAIEVAGKKKHCVLIDYNANGTFNDVSGEAYKCDRIRIGKKGTQDTRYVGKFIEVEGTLYRLEAARDGAYINLTSAEDVKYGNIRVSETIKEFSAGGENGLFKVKLENGIGSLPVGSYSIIQWVLEQKDEKGIRWKLLGSGNSRQGDFNIFADTKAELSIGEPIRCNLDLDTRSSGPQYSFQHNLRGQLGERIELLRNGSRPPAPKIRIKNKDGSYDKTFNLKYG
jgi:hypothetical protein